MKIPNYNLSAKVLSINLSDFEFVHKDKYDLPIDVSDTSGVTVRTEDYTHTHSLPAGGVEILMHYLITVMCHPVLFSLLPY